VTIGNLATIWRVASDRNKQSTIDSTLLGISKAKESFKIAHSGSGTGDRKKHDIKLVPSQKTVANARQAKGETQQHAMTEAGNQTKTRKGRLAMLSEKKQLNLPIFVTSLPKSGTTSTAAYFNCGGYRAAHYWAKDDQDNLQIAGQCIEQNIVHNQPPFAGCGDYDVWTDTGYAEYNSCFYPSIDGLDAIYDAYPNATFLMVIRNTSSWYTSFHSWYDARLFRRWKRCNTTGMPSKGGTWKDFQTYYDWHYTMVRDFAQNRPSLTYVEVQLDSPDTPHILEEAFGISSACWGKCDPQYHCSYTNDTTT
jgi:hypothetical protein